MPTGYTYFIENGDISTGAEFLKKCIRNFGCCIDQREEPLSSPLITDIKPTSYYKEQYESSLKKLEEFRTKTVAEISEIMHNDKQNELISKRSYLSRQELLREKYLKVRKEVEQWIPPTKDHEGIKEFALEQIDMCMPTESDLNDTRNRIKELEESVSTNGAEDSITFLYETLNSYTKILNTTSKRWMRKKNDVQNEVSLLKIFLVVFDKEVYYFGIRKQ